MHACWSLSVAFLLVATAGPALAQRALPQASAGIERVSVDSSGAQASSASVGVALSAGGRFVVFTSAADNLVPADTNEGHDAFVHDRRTRTTECVSRSSGGALGDRDSGDAVSISADGRFVAFQSFATNLVVLDTNGTQDSFLRDRASGSTTRVSVSSAGAQGNAASYRRRPDAR